LSEVVKKACIGFTEVIGTFISEVSTISNDSEDQEEPRTSRRRRTTNPHQQNTDEDEGMRSPEDQHGKELPILTNRMLMKMKRSRRTRRMRMRRRRRIGRRTRMRTRTRKMRRWTKKWS